MQNVIEIWFYRNTRQLCWARIHVWFRYSFGKEIQFVEYSCILIFFDLFKYCYWYVFKYCCRCWRITISNLWVYFSIRMRFGHLLFHGWISVSLSPSICSSLLTYFIAPKNLKRVMSFLVGILSRWMDLCLFYCFLYYFNVCHCIGWSI